ncbi:MAG: MBL fold metallo-hydrolase [Clostridia bacterium]|nr:MBL fold metallo-hydrolase [Clostridia bacterium]
MAKFCSLFSGSSGNCTYISANNTGILIDAGVSAKRIETALMERNVAPSSIQAIFVTHEHSDHICGVRVFAKKYGCEVYGTSGTLTGMEDNGVILNDHYHSISSEKTLAVGDLEIAWIRTPHDVLESCAYVVQTPDERRIAVATDMGHITGEIKAVLSGCDYVLLESNHDEKMLKAGPYPPFLQKRILGPLGHLSNDTCSTLLPELVKSGVSQITLGHLSQQNNKPTLAEQTAVNALEEAGCVRDTDYRLSVAKQISDSPIIWI